MTEAGRLEECLRWVPAHPGDVFYIPSGTVHALGAGIRCYEIQESSDVTYRLWDWGRTGQDGKPRELHTEQAFAVSRTGGLPERPEAAEERQPGGTGRILVDDPHFRLCAMDLDGTFRLPDGSMLFVTPTVPCTVSWDGQEQSVNPWQSVLVPAGLRSVSITGKGRILAAGPK